MNSNFVSKRYNLGNNFFLKTFNIPIYQRLYVWGEDQVNTLLEDLIGSYHHDNKKIYYLGGIVVVENNKKLDLIDGQQRFTTLKILRELLGDENLCLDFSIRDNVWEDFNSSDKSDNIDIRKMQNSKKILKIGLEKKYNNTSIDKSKFLKYIQEKVYLVVTTVPYDTDLNKLFELINGRGEQLQQHEVLKAKLLSHIKTENKKYGNIWDICANMDDHIDINIKKIILKKTKHNELKNISWQDYFKVYHSISFEELLTKFNFANGNTNGSDISSIYEIINTLDTGRLEHNENDPEDEASTQYLSIISFPLFLLYSLVSLKKDDYFSAMEKGKIEFKDKNLINIFEFILLEKLDKNEKKSELEVKNFIENLFKFRKLFDKWIIRNRKEIGDISNNTDHCITSIVEIKNNNTITRQIENLKDSRDLSLLQSMLYHSHTRNTQEWIIPFLSLNMEKDFNVKNNLKTLKKIDNVLYSQFNRDNSILKRASTFSLENSLINRSEIINYLNKEDVENYHDFSQYWFYKMDWIIWDLSAKQDNKFKFTARNSIEHISAQTKSEKNKIENTVSSKYEHSFGNLALISVSQNSSFSNKSYLEKMAEFKEKEIQNLKMRLIYDNKAWNDETCKEHLDECLEKVKEYYPDTKLSSNSL